MTKPKHEIYHGDCLERLRELPDNSVDVMITDPPYGLSAPPDIDEVLAKWEEGEKYEHKSKGFMGAKWDSHVPGPTMWKEAYRVFKPGAMGAVFAGSRTVDLMQTALEMAGFEIVGHGQWVYGSGMPKNHNIAKALRKSSNPAAETWEGYGTGLKPAHEPIIYVQRPGGTPAAVPMAFFYTPKAPGKERYFHCSVCGSVHPKKERKNHDKDVEGHDAKSVKLHPTQKPLALMRELVQRMAKPGDLVLDPFTGSGTTAVAAIEHGCSFEGADIHKEHVKIAEYRVAQIEPPKTGGILSMFGADT